MKNCWWYALRAYQASTFVQNMFRYHQQQANILNVRSFTSFDTFGTYKFIEQINIILNRFNNIDFNLNHTLAFFGFSLGCFFRLVSLSSSFWLCFIADSSFIIQCSMYLVSSTIVHCYFETAPSLIYVCIWRASNMHRLAMLNGNLFLVFSNTYRKYNIKIKCMILESHISCLCMVWGNHFGTQQWKLKLYWHWRRTKFGQ